MAVISSPEQMPGSQRAFCSSVREREEVGEADVVVERPARARRRSRRPAGSPRRSRRCTGSRPPRRRRGPRAPPCRGSPGRRPCVNSSRSTMPARSHASWWGASSLAMKPRTESRNSSCSSSNSVRSMAATVTRWPRRRRAGRLCRVDRDDRAVRVGERAGAGRPGGGHPHPQRGLGGVGAGRAAGVSDAAYVDIGPLHAPPRSGWTRRLARDDDGTVVGHGHAFWREGSPAACTLRVFVDPAAPPAGRRPGARASTSSRRRGPPVAPGVTRRGGPGQRAEAAIARGRRVPARIWSWS